MSILVLYTVESFVGRTKTDLICVNCQCAVGEVVSSLGQYVEFCLVTGHCRQCQQRYCDDSIVIWGNRKCFRSFNERITRKSHLPGKWRAEAPVNKKLELKNVIIDWLENNKLGWEASHAQQQGVGAGRLHMPSSKA